MSDSTARAVLVLREEFARLSEATAIVGVIIEAMSANLGLAPMTQTTGDGIDLSQ